MQKKKYDLTSDLVDISYKKTLEQPHQESSSRLVKHAQPVLLTIKIEEELRAEFKSWCARHRLKMNEAFIKGFMILKDKEGV